MKPASELQSKLAKAKGLGSAKHGVGHWWFQRVTAVALIPLALLFVAAVLRTLMAHDITTVMAWFASPVNAFLLATMLVAMFYHAKLGLQVVIEDYVKCPCAKYGLLLGNIFFCFGGATLSIITVLKLHFLDVTL